MSNINQMVLIAINEEKGQTFGAEMFNTGKIAGLYDEPGIDGSAGRQGSVLKTGDTSKFNVDSTPGNQEPTNPNPLPGTTPPVNKFGGNPMFAKAQTLARSVADNREVKLHSSK